MAAVNIYECFPTVISKFSFHQDEKMQVKMTSLLKKMKKNNKVSIQTADNLYSMSYAVDLKNAVLLESKDYLKKTGYQFEKLEMTGMWANYLSEGNIHPPHTHANNFLSGVYFLEVDDGASPIQFFDPRPQANVLRPRNIPSWRNCTMLQFDAVQGVGYIFPSWLEHWVPPTKGERMSISWNIILRGDYGEPGALQNVNI